MLVEKKSALEVFETLMKFCKEKRPRVANLMWCWWCERNNIREGKKARASHDLAWTVLYQGKEFISETTRVINTVKTVTKKMGSS